MPPRSRHTPTRRAAADALQSALPTRPGQRFDLPLHPQAASEPDAAPAEDRMAAPSLRETLAAQYGADAVNSRLRYDRFADDLALERQLAFETKQGITLQEYRSILPAAAPHGLPPGWRADDRLARDVLGKQTLRTCLTGPDGESGVVVRSIDGHTLHLDKAYKGTLPTRLENVPGLDRPVSTINYLTARACRLMDVPPGSVRRIKVNRLQHRPTLAHLEWLQRWHPTQPVSKLIGHTTWARSYIRETAGMFGQTVRKAGRIDEQGSPAWLAVHPDAALRDWSYMGMENARKTIKYLTGHKLPKVDDPRRNWRSHAEAAIDRYRQEQCAGLSPALAEEASRKTEALLLERLGAIRNEDAALARRYGIPADQSPTLVNFDVTFRLVRQSSDPVPIPAAGPIERRD